MCPCRRPLRFWYGLDDNAEFRYLRTVVLVMVLSSQKGTSDDYNSRETVVPPVGIVYYTNPGTIKVRYLILLKSGVPLPYSEGFKILRL